MSPEKIRSLIYNKKPLETGPVVSPGMRKYWEMFLGKEEATRREAIINATSKTRMPLSEKE